MHFAKLRLLGFKSFVESTDLRIEPGLTGIVGPNGCGKSNLLEALRWVMGAASAKAMRGEGMDDVIFSGSHDRPARNIAEVVLTIDNEAADGPGGWSSSTVEISRRIERGEGSRFRINGAEARARDVQLLFADASTGANSPALVRQGQISELIAAKPQNRRRILEEAAGVAGLHGRRHEAELKVRAARANLDRLADLSDEIEASLSRLRREARQAARYRSLSAQIRHLRAGVLLGAWQAARLAVSNAERDYGAAWREAESASLVAGRAARQSLAAADAVPPAQAHEQAAAARAQATQIELERLERSLEAARVEAGRRNQDIDRIAADSLRERQIESDAREALSRLQRQSGALEAASAAAAGLTARLQADQTRARDERARAEAELERLASAAAARLARAQAAEVALEAARNRSRRLGAATAEAERRLKAFASASDDDRLLASKRSAASEAELVQARAQLEGSERDRAAAAEAESAARVEARRLEDELGALLAQARGLAGLSQAPARSGPGAAIESVRPEPGLEAALSAALGEDLAAALDAAAPAFWAGAAASPPEWPAGAVPLATRVEAPPQLAARLAFVALVAPGDGPRLQKSLPPGARLVSTEGDLWRWDGLTITARAPRPAQARLEQRARLNDLEARIDALRPSVQGAEARRRSRVADLERCVAETAANRQALLRAEAAAAQARSALARLESESSRREAQGRAEQQRLEQLAADAEEARATAAAAEAEVSRSREETDLAPDLGAAREACAAARSAESLAIAACELERRGAQARVERLAELGREIGGWRGRADEAMRRQLVLAEAARTAQAAHAAAVAAPARAATRRQALLDALGEVRRSLAAAQETLQTVQAARIEADREARAAEAQAGRARETLAAAKARFEAEQARLEERRARISEALSIPGEALEQRLAEAPIEPADDPHAAETKLAEMEGMRAAIGPVNLLAEREAAELAQRAQALAAERSDLGAALDRLGAGIAELNAEGRTRLAAAFGVIDDHFRSLFQTLFEGGQAELRLVEADDPLEAGLEIFACPPGKRLSVMSLMSGGEQALTALALILAVFLANPAPICVLDEVDAPLDDANVERFCALLEDMRRRASTRFLVITHNPLTMSRMDRLFGVTMPERGVSQLVSVDLRQAEILAAA